MTIFLSLLRTNLMKCWLSILLILITAGVLKAAEFPIIDAHSQADQHISFEEILTLMEEAGVSHTILSLRGQRRPEELIPFAARHPDMITPAVRTKGDAYLKGSKQFERFLNNQMQMGQFGAMAEVLLWHAKKEEAPTVTLGSGKKGKPPQVVVPPDDPRVQVALGKAIDKGWPFVAHIEFDAIGADRDVFMKKFEDLLQRHLDHPFVLMHMGELDAKQVRRLIDAYRNIHFNTAMSNPIAVNRSVQPLVNLFKGTSLAPEWRELFMLYPDRFIMAFDNVFAGHWRKLYVKQAALWRKALSHLPEDVAHAVAHGNAERLWRLPPAPHPAR
jgi:hypothetical protein